MITRVIMHSTVYKQYFTILLFLTPPTLFIHDIRVSHDLIAHVSYNCVFTWRVWGAGHSHSSPVNKTLSAPRPLPLDTVHTACC